MITIKQNVKITYILSGHLFLVKNKFLRKNKTKFIGSFIACTIDDQ